MTTSADSIFRAFQADELGVVVTKGQTTLFFKTPPARLTNAAKTALEKLGLTQAIYKQCFVQHSPELSREKNFGLWEELNPFPQANTNEEEPQLKKQR